MPRFERKGGIGVGDARHPGLNVVFQYSSVRLTLEQIQLTMQYDVILFLSDIGNYLLQR